MLREQVDALLETARTRLGVDAFAFYVRDPSWSGNTLLYACPGVTIKEAVYGLNHPQLTSTQNRQSNELFFECADDDQFRRGISDKVQNLLRICSYFAAGSNTGC